MYIEANLSVLQAFAAALVLFTGIGLALSRQEQLSPVRVRRKSRNPKPQPGREED